VLDAVLAIGAEHRRVHGDAVADARDELRDLLGSDGISPDELPTGRELERLSTAITEDFVQGRITSVAGWQLATTEVRFAAAVAGLIEP